MVHLSSLVLLLVAGVCHVAADLPVHCLHSELYGTWTFFLGPGGGDKETNCSQPFPVVKALQIRFEDPNIVKYVRDVSAPNGSWTTIYDEGWEVTFDALKYFSFFKYIVQPDGSSISYCNETFPGYYHDFEGNNWGCYVGWKTGFASDHCKRETKATGKSNTGKLEMQNLTLSYVGSAMFPNVEGDSAIEMRRKPRPDTFVEKYQELTQFPLVSKEQRDLEEVSHSGRAASVTTVAMFQQDHELVRKVNSNIGVPWEATSYLEMESKSEVQIEAMMGMRVNTMNHPRAVVDDRPDEEKYAGLPEKMDYRNLCQGWNCKNYITYVKDQDQKSAHRVCGSCYAYAVLDMVEARVRIKTKLKKQDHLSSMDVISCSMYAQGCDGGFPYLVGKYGEDFGFVRESCYPYNLTKYYEQKPTVSNFMNRNMPCNGRCNDPIKRYVQNYHYVGGYYGNCSEVAMMKEIYEKGPIVAGFWAENDLLYYKRGVYKHMYKRGYWAEMVAGHRTSPSYDPSKCMSGCRPPKRLEWEKTNHAVLLVGWGKEMVNQTETKYWVAKNSWGDKWGDKGYFKILRGSDESAVESMAVAMDPVCV